MEAPALAHIAASIAFISILAASVASIWHDLSRPLDRSNHS